MEEYIKHSDLLLDSHDVFWTTFEQEKPIVLFVILAMVFFAELVWRLGMVKVSTRILLLVSGKLVFGNDQAC